MTLGTKIFELRTARMLSQEAFAEQLDVSRQTVSKWENDLAYPEIEKLIAISKIFSVSTDYLLLDGTGNEYGIFSSETAELIETEKFALLLETDGNILTAKLYKGIARHKNLIAICEEDRETKKISFAYQTESAETVCYGEKSLSEALGTSYEAARKSMMYHTESFRMASVKDPLPTVSEVGIRASLIAWRSGVVYRASQKEMMFYLCTKTSEFVFHIQTDGHNVYCGASQNCVFDLGLFSGSQYFRIRNYDDNTLPFCVSYASFTKKQPNLRIPLERCRYGECIRTKEGYLFCVKRYKDTEIVLQGCNDEEYVYCKDEPCAERIE